MTSDEIKCPCCGQVTKPSGRVRVSLEENLLYFGDRALPLTNNLAELAHILARKMPATVHRQNIMQQMWGHTEVEAKTLDVTIYQLRRVLKPLGLGIENTYAIGWRMVELSETERPRRRIFPLPGAQHAQA